MSETNAHETRRATNGRSTPPRWVLIAGGAVLLVAVVVAIVLATRGGGEPEPLEPEVVTLPVPTPTVEPVERAEGTAFAQALPSTVLQLALSAFAEEPSLVRAGALEAYRLDYTDGGTTEVVVLAGQWATPEEAAAAMADAVAAGTPEGAETTEGTVEVDGAQVGTSVLVAGDGTDTVWWTNGTVMLQATGPSGTVADVQTAYPL